MKKKKQNELSLLEPPFDFSYLKKEFGDDDSIIKSFLILFIDSINEYQKKMEEAIASSDWDLAHSASHKITSSCKLLGLNSLLILINKVDQIAVNKKEINSLISTYKEIKAIFQKLVIQIESIST